MDHRRSGGGDGSPSPGEEAAVRPKQRRRKEKRRVSDPVVPFPGWALARATPLKHKGFQGTVPASSIFQRELVVFKPSQGGTAVDLNQWLMEVSRRCCYMWIPTRLLRKFNRNVGAAVKAYIEEEGNVPAAWKETEEESIKQNNDAILKKGCLDDAEMGQSALRSSHRSSGLEDSPEEVPFAGEETSLILMMDKEPKPSCFGDDGKIAQDEDEQHSDKIGVHAIEEHKQEQGSASGHVQALLDMDAETVTEKILYFSKRLKFDPPECGDYQPAYDQEQLNQLAEQLALYRIRAYELTVDRKLADLSDENLKLEYPASKLYDNCYFKYYEESLEWYFDSQRCKSGRFDNYQRLVLHGYRGYLDWDFYCSILNTYEEDLAYVQYFEEVANKTKWIEDYLGGGKTKWERIESLAFMRALEIAAGFPNVSRLLVTYGFKEYINSIKRDHSSKGLDGLYFEIWKRVAKGKMSFKEALLEIDIKDLCPLRTSEIKHELENNPGSSPIKDYYDARVAVIDKMASDDKARQLIRETIRESVSKPKYYLDYARKKLDIANGIKLIPKGRR